MMVGRRAAAVLVLGTLGFVLLSGTIVRCDTEESPLADEDVASGHTTATDTTAAQRSAEEAAATKQYTFKKGAEEFTFQAEVNRLMDILINSLYSNKDIFLRELISNASDALDKIRLLALTDKDQLGENPDLEIRISLDHEKRILRIRDTGVGMTKEDLKSNLGTIAKSGTSAFLENLQKGGDVNLIGQFGVGFYSVYLVADYVEVVSKHNDDKQWIWESKADGNFAISEDTDGEPLGRGTQINIYLKEETNEYSEESKLKELVSKYSEFINFPIYLYESHEVDVPVEEEEEELATEEVEEAASADDDVEDEDEEEEEEEDAAPKTVKKTVWEWSLLNDNKPIWLRNPSDVTEEEYSKFYKALAKTSQEPLGHVHFKGEGDVEFRSILYIPSEAPPGMLDSYYSKQAGLDLYVRRVFITNEFEDLIPRYLSFMKGLVDSDSLPLSVSRETLQEHAALKVIKKKLVRKALDALKQLADADVADAEDEEKEAAPSDAGKYTKFWNQFGKLIKLGIIEDSSNRQRLAKLLRLHTSKSPDKLTSLAEYIERMKPNQKAIYYLAGETQQEVANSPFLEKLLDRDYEVIYFTDPVDEYVMQHLQEFDDKSFQNAQKENLKLGTKDDKEKKREKALREEYKPLVAWWKEQLGRDVSSVKVSRRLAKSPAIVVASQHGWTANMERIMRAQAVSEQRADNMMMKGQKTLEINPRHPLVEELKAKFDEDSDNKDAKSIARIIFDSALLESGYPIEDPKDFNTRIYDLLARSLSIKRDVTKGVEFDASLADDEDAEEDSDAVGGLEDLPDGLGLKDGESQEEFIERIMAEHKAKTDAEGAEKDEL